MNIRRARRFRAVQGLAGRSFEERRRLERLYERVQGCLLCGEPSVECFAFLPKKDLESYGLQPSDARLAFFYGLCVTCVADVPAVFVRVQAHLRTRPSYQGPTPA